MGQTCLILAGLASIGEVVASASTCRHGRTILLRVAHGRDNVLANAFEALVLVLKLVNPLPLHLVLLAKLAQSVPLVRILVAQLCIQLLQLCNLRWTNLLVTFWWRWGAWQKRRIMYELGREAYLRLLLG